MMMPEGNVKKIVDVCDQKNGQNRHQHISSPTSVTNIDVATISIRPIMFRLNFGIGIGHNFFMWSIFRIQKLGTDSGGYQNFDPIPWEIDF